MIPSMCVNVLCVLETHILGPISHVQYQPYVSCHIWKNYMIALFLAFYKLSVAFLTNYYLCSFHSCDMFTVCLMLTCCSDLYMLNAQDLRFAWPFSCLQFVLCTALLLYYLSCNLHVDFYYVWKRYFFFCFLF